ncbi:MAG: lipid-A-disaccharide synthase [Luminiphilus sp.]
MTDATLRLGMCAGEASGDILAGAVLRAWRGSCPDIDARGIGGSEMQAAGFVSSHPMDRLSVMGLIEPLKRLPELLKIRRTLLAEQLSWAPDLFVGVDSPDFNLTVERRLRERGITTAHLVSPSVWAWRRGRIKGIRESVDKMLCLLPFEVAVYEQAGIDAVCVGHPLIDDLKHLPPAEQLRAEFELPVNKNLVAVLPGSREAEVRHLMPVFAESMHQLQQRDASLSFVIPAANVHREGQIREILRGYALNVKVVSGSGRAAMAASDAVLLASGTATLEAMLMRKPMVIAYRMAPVSWAILSRMVQTPHVGLPNILAGRAVVPEHLQHEATAEKLANSMMRVLETEAKQQVNTFELLAEQIGGHFAERTMAALQSMIAA